MRARPGTRAPRRFALALALALPLAAALGADGGPGAETAAETAAGTVPDVPAATDAVTRFDLGRVLQGLERDQLAAPGLPDARLTALGQRLDASAWDYFSGELRRAGARMCALRPELVEPGDARPPADPRLDGVRLFAASRGGPEPPRLTLRSVWELPGAAAGAVEAELQVRDVSGVRVLARTPLRLEFEADGRLRPLEVRAPAPPAGEPGCSYELVEPGSGRRHGRWEWAVLAEPLEARAAELARAVREGAPEGDDPLAEAREILLARCALLAEPLDPDRSASFLARPGLLWPALANEALALEQGIDPYRLRAGSTWRVLRHGSRALPLWVHAPPALDDERELPLLIALHGAGGDELYHAELGGAGLLARRADEHGFLVAAPFTPDFLYDFGAFDRLLEDLCARYPVDRARVFVMGHSLGALTAETLCRVRGEALAGAVCIAGGRKPGGETPVHYLAGAGDGVFPVPQLRDAAARAVERGVPATFEELPGGHILVLPGALQRGLELLGLVP